MGSEELLSESRGEFPETLCGMVADAR